MVLCCAPSSFGCRPISSAMGVVGAAPVAKVVQVD